ncbi:hypothetical protein LCL96_12470 [Rossellomorea aquimaris]|nr:hypothetical protein [Rossellomorea aquimaris]MCA1059762.1 hypothetical protein [Rossellomorea aquimaris]
MKNQVYTDRQYEIYKHNRNEKCSMIAEVWKEGRLIAALFEFEEVKCRET